MTKLSEAEKKRRKERDIIDRATHYLNIIWACRDNAVYNGLHRWSKAEMSGAMDTYEGFTEGVVLADGRKWHNRFNKLWEDYEALHGKLFPDNKLRNRSG